LDDINFDTVYDIAFGKAIVLEHRHDDHENLETKRKIWNGVVGVWRCVAVQPQTIPTQPNPTQLKPNQHQLFIVFLNSQVFLDPSTHNSFQKNWPRKGSRITLEKRHRRVLMADSIVGKKAKNISGVKHKIQHSDGLWLGFL